MLVTSQYFDELRVPRDALSSFRAAMLKDEQISAGGLQLK
jgi:hypothetical protein